VSRCDVGPHTMSHIILALVAMPRPASCWQTYMLANLMLAGRPHVVLLVVSRNRPVKPPLVRPGSVKRHSHFCDADLECALVGRVACRYADQLAQVGTGRKISPNPADWRCDDTGVTENLWLNLSTGHIGSGRQVGSATGAADSCLEGAGHACAACLPPARRVPHTQPWSDSPSKHPALAPDTARPQQSQCTNSC